MGLVAVNSDASVRRLGKGDDRPLQPQDDRAAIVAALESVSLVTVFDEDVPLAVLEIARPDVYVKGGDYVIDAIPEARLARGWGARTVAIPFVYRRSTTELVFKPRDGQGPSGGSSECQPQEQSDVEGGIARAGQIQGEDDRERARSEPSSSAGADQ